ncbi:8-oxo-dGTP diphosphatase [Microlunatus flavus]|uniref:8-oxo-dGTP diphosphatase n=2 Tax=Microlunatus flavus TaxID=1036181 RepID=A0A1H8Z2S5_9ACTN|nr:8-oxo-dGTP diphosphatase [Microlunatus flavus]
MRPGGVQVIPAKPVLAGGAVVTREHPVRGTEVVVVHRKRYDDWSLPKGKVEAGESVPAAAVREVLEETGVSVRLGVPLDTVSYDLTKPARPDLSKHGKVLSGIKRVSYWGATATSSVKRAPDHEVDVVAWLPVRAALGRLSYAADHFLLEQYLDQPVTTPLLIVRHAKAMDRKDWSKKDAARPINALGRRQAKLLVPMLRAYGVERLVSSTAVRCLSTLQPYAEASKHKVNTYPGLTEEEGSDDPKGVAKIVRRIRTSAIKAGRPTAICVHRPVLPHILDALEIAPTTLVTGEFLVAHVTGDGSVHALERHRPQA